MDSVLSNMGLLDNSDCMAVLYGRGYRLWLMAYGLWLMAFGLWLLAYGLWLLAYGLWLMAYGLWLMAFGFWLVVEIHHKIKAVKQTTLHFHIHVR